MLLEKTLESPLVSKENKPVNLKGNQPWILIGRTDAGADASILWPPDVKSWLIGKDPDLGKNWRQKEKRATEDEMVGWHQRFSGHELGQTPGDGEGQGSLMYCSLWGCEEWDTTWLLISSAFNSLYKYHLHIVTSFQSILYGKWVQKINLMIKT